MSFSRDLVCLRSLYFFNPRINMSPSTFAMYLLQVGAALCLILPTYLIIRLSNLTYPEWNSMKTELALVTTMLTLYGKIAEKKLFKERSFNALSFFEAAVKKYGGKTAVIYVDGEQEERLTFVELDREINRMANYLLSISTSTVGSGEERDEVIGIWMQNSLEFIITWLALMRLGKTAAFLNPNLKGASLQHVIKISGCKKIICQFNGKGEMSRILKDVLVENGHLRDVKVYEIRNKEGGEGGESWTTIVKYKKLSSSPPKLKKIIQEISDIACLVFTSGTTGLPKAAFITLGRLCAILYGAKGMLRLTKKDIVYTALPLYHSSASMMGLGAAFCAGSTIIIVPKFSASRCMDECSKYQVTVLQYIGELCRFLLNSPFNENDTKHKIRLAYGNGLRKDIWLPFKKRFNIPAVLEFYGSTEGTAVLVNYQDDDRFGVASIGRLGTFQSISNPMTLVKYDQNTGKPFRNKEGHCIKCKPNQVGELIGFLRSGDPIMNFQGYKNNELETNKKVLKDVFDEGDRWFSSGDLAMKDTNGYFYFHDRLGDTFRWKGENVSTTEVANAICLAFPGEVDDATVYGVNIPHTDGKAGMASLVLNRTVSQRRKKEILETMVMILPLAKYAVPVFIRILKEMPSTDTLKQTKFHLQEEAFSLDVVKDMELYWNPSSKYEVFTRADLLAINEGTVKI